MELAQERKDIKCKHMETIDNNGVWKEVIERKMKGQRTRKVIEKEFTEKKGIVKNMKKEIKR